MTQVATFGRRPGPAASSAPASRPVQTVRPAAALTPAAPALSAYDAEVSARAFAAADDDLDSWKSERRTELWEALGPWRWAGIGFGAGALALWLTRADPGHISGVLASMSAVSWMAAGRRYRMYLRFKSGMLGSKTP